ncbi:hypothetical protein KQX54_006944 [Cotesia glomerata]|uniref:Uncharacterized protein n=1 Tax=Cotesia glomerata TaxID=32391 RepID=A0AAV7IK17_COTGL|nr:hypothetical protein KQX54_006944 [Cotesia glomerata]
MARCVLNEKYGHFDWTISRDVGVRVKVAHENQQTCLAPVDSWAILTRLTAIGSVGSSCRIVIKWLKS